MINPKMDLSFKLLILFGYAFFSACLPKANQTAGPAGVSGANPPLEISAGEDAAKDSGPDAAVPDETSHQPGPGGSMPSGTLAPPPLVPINFAYKAEGFYCRFAGEASRAMIWGKLYRKEGDGQFDSEFAECTEPCQGKGLGITYQYQGGEASEGFAIEDAPDFRFVVDIDDPKRFSLTLYLQQTVALIGQETPTPSKGSFVDVSSFQPYAVDGKPADCPSRDLKKVPVIERALLPRR